MDKAKKLLLRTEGSTNDQTSDVSKSVLAVEPATTTAMVKIVDERSIKIEFDVIVRLLLKFVQYGSRKIVSHFMMSTNK